MRAVMDAKETVVEFVFSKQPYRLILPYGKSTFSLDRLIQDDYRHWLHRWEGYALGTYQKSHVTSILTSEGHAVELGLNSAVNDAIGYYLYGPTNGKHKRVYNA